DLFKSNSLPQPLSDFSNRIRENDGLYKIDKYDAASKTLADLTEGDIYYYPGCVTMGNNSKVISGIKEIAVEADISLKTDTEKRVCCGAPSIYLGDIEKAKDLAQKNVKQIKDAKVKAIICECPECVHALKNQYPTLGYKLNIPIYHISEWILSLIDCGKIKLKDGDELDKYQEYFPISYHDPCVLSRKLGIVEEPYKILRTMFPENFKEATYSKELTHCCGFGGLANIVNHSIANTMSANRLAEFQKEDVKTIVTSCPTCWYSFMKNNPDMQFEIKDLVELVTELMVRKK
ncbi:MAG: (Fe-S)-binding protein, partial [Candidatus Heimdallarchaeota archaeon]